MATAGADGFNISKVELNRDPVVPDMEHDFRSGEEAFQKVWLQTATGEHREYVVVVDRRGFLRLQGFNPSQLGWDQPVVGSPTDARGH